jgi:hypothetical protein
MEISLGMPIELSTEDILVTIPRTAEKVSSIEHNWVLIEIYQCPVDKNRKTGIFYGYMHSNSFEECCKIKIILSNEPFDYVNASKELFSIFLNYVMYKRNEDGISIH